MAVVEFKYYLHDSSGENLAWALGKSNPDMTEDEAEALGERLREERPFYEVTLNCQVDTDTLEVKILSATP